MAFSRFRSHGTGITGYNRALAMFVPHKEPGFEETRQTVPNSALLALANNEMMLLYLFCRWAGVTEIGYSMRGLGKTGEAFRIPTRKEVDYALKFMR